MSKYQKQKHQQRPTRYTVLLSKDNGAEKFILKSDDLHKEIICQPGQKSPLGEYDRQNPRGSVDFALKKASQLSSIPIDKIWLSRELDERMGALPNNGYPVPGTSSEPQNNLLAKYGMEFLYKAKGTVFGRVPDQILVNEGDFYFDPEKVSLVVEDEKRLTLYLDDANIEKIEIPIDPK